jgi:hypothetical protein
LSLNRIYVTIGTALLGKQLSLGFVAELIDLIREQISADVDIAIIESDASAMRCKYAFRMLGFEKLAQEKNVRLVNLSEDQNDNVTLAVTETTTPFRSQNYSRADLKLT